MNRSNNYSNFSPLSSLSVNLPARHHHHHDDDDQSSKRKENIDLFSPKGRPMMRRRSGKNCGKLSVSSRGTSSMHHKTYSCPPALNHLPVKSTTTQFCLVTKKNIHPAAVVPMVVRLRRMKRRLLQEHVKDQPEVTWNAPSNNRNL
ncbi:unnamed protein product [Cylindrotheca closterium]|uniref:Uncharacterized protein n=1 Tax=Cylindrotheca closterium TaxID=2856 RepID=A0AAD2JLI9_9STRA|nr:unnamed protein product [Cylindrotheca closterium]